jgi:hypothetical protein
VVDLDTERSQEPAKSLRLKGVEINFGPRKVFEQAGILLVRRRGGGIKCLPLLGERGR